MRSSQQAFRLVSWNPSDSSTHNQVPATSLEPKGPKSWPNTLKFLQENHSATSAHLSVRHSSRKRSGAKPAHTDLLSEAVSDQKTSPVLQSRPGRGWDRRPGKPTVRVAEVECVVRGVQPTQVEET